jgi:hypothetical protein
LLVEWIDKRTREVALINIFLLTHIRVTQFLDQ